MMLLFFNFVEWPNNRRRSYGFYTWMRFPKIEGPVVATLFISVPEKLETYKMVQIPVSLWHE